jgi:hypothetical protein
MASGRQYDPQSFWLKGARSDVDPLGVAADNYLWARNVYHLRGMPTTRPRLRAIAHFERGWPQGVHVYETITSRKYLVACVSGQLFVSADPFRVWSKIGDVSLAPDARQVFFSTALKNAHTLPDGTTTIVPPVNLMFATDGLGKAVIYDGARGRYSTPGAPEFGLPIGSFTLPANNRLALASGNAMHLSDLDSPDQFIEELTLGSGGGTFNFRKPITCLGQPFQNGALLAFTNSQTDTFQTQILDRTTWFSTQDFRKTILPKIGCVAAKSFVNHYGLANWFSNNGQVTMDDAFQAYRGSKLNMTDEPMQRSKNALSGDRTQVCAISHDKYIITSVPSFGPYNGESWLYSDNNLGNPSWESVIEGITPVDWSSAIFAGRQRTFCLSIDDPTDPFSGCTVWEFMPNPAANMGLTGDEGPVRASLETGIYNMTRGFDDSDLAFVEVELDNCVGKVDFRIAFAPARTGAFRNLKATTINAGSPMQPFPDVDGEMPLGALLGCRPESRVLRSEEFHVEQDSVTEDAKESFNPANRDRGFIVYLEWDGQCSVRAVRVFLEPTHQDYLGDPTVLEALPNCASEAGAKRTALCYVSGYNGIVPVLLPSRPPSAPTKCALPYLVKSTAAGVTGLATLYCPTPGASIYGSINGSAITGTGLSGIIAGQTVSLIGQSGVQFNMAAAQPAVYEFIALKYPLENSSTITYDNSSVQPLPQPTLLISGTAGTGSNLAIVTSLISGAVITQTLNGTASTIIGTTVGTSLMGNTFPSVYCWVLSKAGWTPSPIECFDNSNVPQTAAVIVGTSHVQGTRTNASLSSATAGATIWMSLNGTPFSALGTTPISQLLENFPPSVYRFYASFPGYRDSSITTYDNSAAGVVADPVFHPSSPQGVAGTSTLTCATAGAAIVWSLNAPDGPFNAYVGAFPISATIPSVYYARATKAGFIDSNLVIYSNSLQGQCLTPVPTLSQPVGTFNNPCTVRCDTPGASIFYRNQIVGWTLLGPTGTTLFLTNDPNTNPFQFYAVAAGFSDSGVAVISNALNLGVTATPSIVIVSGTPNHTPVNVRLADVSGYAPDQQYKMFYQTTKYDSHGNATISPWTQYDVVHPPVLQIACNTFGDEIDAYATSVNRTPSPTAVFDNNNGT